jgi:hypothetical protein
VLLKTFSMAPNLTTHFREGHQEEPSADASSCSFLHMATSRVQAGIQRRCSLHMATCADCADGSRTARAWSGRENGRRSRRWGRTARSASSPATVLASCPVYHGPLTAYYFRPSNPRPRRSHTQPKHRCQTRPFFLRNTFRLSMGCVNDEIMRVCPPFNLERIIFLVPMRCYNDFYKSNRRIGCSASLFTRYAAAATGQQLHGTSKAATKLTVHILRPAERRISR